MKKTIVLFVVLAALVVPAVQAQTNAAELPPARVDSAPPLTQETWSRLIADDVSKLVYDLLSGISLTAQ